MKMFHRRTVQPAVVPARGMTLAEAMTLPAVTDLITAGRALGIGRNKCYARWPGRAGFRAASSGRATPGGSPRSACSCCWA